MDDELQGARRIIKEVVKPVFGFFVNSIEEEDEEDNDIIQEEAPARRSALSRDDNVQGSGSILKLSLASSEEQQERENEDNEVCMLIPLSLLLDLPNEANCHDMHLATSHTKHAGVEHGRELWWKE